MHVSSAIVNLQGVSTELNKNDAIAKGRILVEKL